MELAFMWLSRGQKQPARLRTIGLLAAACALLLAACGSVSAVTRDAVPNTATVPPSSGSPAFNGLPETPVPVQEPTPTTVPDNPPTAAAAPQGFTLWLPEEMPASFRDGITMPDGWEMATSPETASLVFGVSPSGMQETGVATWIYVLTAPFPTVTDAVTTLDLRNVWSGSSTEAQPFQTILVDPSTYAIFSAFWGAPGASVQPAPADQHIEKAWSTPATWAIIPFEQLEPRWKVIQVDEQSPVRKDFDRTRYPLAVPFTLHGDSALREQFLSTANLPSGNRDESKLTTLMLTGVTALVRGTASLMEVIGMTYPAQDIGPWLREADILHISNEVPFARNCPQPFDWKDLVFCSQTEYIQLLEDVGADVIELTGDHFADWGPDAMLYTLELYKERGWPYYGGGANLAEAQKPALLEHNGNKIAFLGCNGKEPGYATASQTNPGAAHCDFTLMAQQIKDLRAEGYLPVVTFQHLEYYQYIALPELQTDFRQVADAGAIIVSGSQAHQPHAFEFRGGALLHYGLGNLFFDQTNQGDPPRTAFIDRHVIYNGRHISTELLTIYLVDYARSRPMTVDERKALLETIFAASGW